MESTHNFLFVSDLHLSEGRHPATGLIHRNEDFFHDLAFAQFIAHHVNLSRDPNAHEYYQKPWKLIINGDIFDFLQVVSKPPIEIEIDPKTQKEVKFVTLNVVDSNGNPIKKRKKLSENEDKFGLGTTSEEIVWKLNQIAEGHPQFFQALAWFVAQEGNELVLMKGNHDIEIVWTAVHKRMSQLLVAAYAGWRLRIVRGDVETPLVLYDDMSDNLNVDDVEESIVYPPLYYYEKDVFYAEHGCQYDPANAFNNFVDPRLPAKTDYIELPEGSLFVRYFFNKVEIVHPFADNMKPITRYIKWLFSNATTSLFSFATELLPDYLKALWQIKKKSKAHKNRQTPQNEFERELFKYQAESRAALKKGSKQTTRRLFISVLLIPVSIIALFWGIRLLVLAHYWWMLLAFGLSIVMVFLSSYFLQSLDKLLADSFLYKAAVKICRRLNSPEETTFSSVPYIIFGHDHAARVHSIELEKNPDSYRHWYINTGAWVPVFSEDERLLRDDEQLTFLRIVPSRIAIDAHRSNKDVPELLQWSAEANAPLPVRLFD